MFEWFKRSKPILGLSEEATEKLYKEIEELLLRLHPKENCEGKCKHQDPEKDLPVILELIPRVFLLHRAINDKETEQLLQRTIKIMLLSFCEKHNIEFFIKP